MAVQDFLNIDIEFPVHEELESDLEDKLIKICMKNNKMKKLMRMLKVMKKKK
jgi:hypothetical protein